jgi:FKBP-type peptidyl-prolyl cis-trans isomerase 2
MPEWESLTEDGGIAVRFSKQLDDEDRSTVPNKRAKVAYTGALSNGAVFDSSGGYAVWFPLGEGKLIEGWERCLRHSQPGDEFELLVSPQYGYGDAGSGAEVPPGSTLLFTVKVEDTERPAISAKAALKEQRAAATKQSEEAAAKRAAAQAETDARKSAAAARAAEMAAKRAGGKGGKPNK